ncbi:hypothetical protein BDC45DRAFT_493801 [Circinella umbellata]|nr:hypothetical protein BDC45DRAFT_493801 [Circinella umbellata]
MTTHNNNNDNGAYNSRVTTPSTTTISSPLRPTPNGFMTPLPFLQTSTDSNNSGSSSAKRRCTTPSSICQQQQEIPTYLQNTLYATLLREQQRDQHELQLKSKSNHNNINNDNDNNVPDLRLPSLWNRHDKSRHLEVENGGLDLVYTGPGKTEHHAASVRSNFPIRHQCGIYYYEMKIISKGEDGFIGMGFCSAKNGLDRLPGWDKDSWGYHGDDGHSFEESGTGKSYGPRFSTGDVIGCGINMADETAFYTKNGTYLGIAFQKLNLSMDLYPCVGLRTLGEHVTVNFGQDPFIFDIVHYIKERKDEIFNQVMKKENKIHTGESMDRLVLTYLVYQGYMGTAKAALNNIKHASGRILALSHSGTSKADDKEEEDIFRRQNIRSAILKGDIDKAIELAKSYFPQCMEEEDTIAHDIMFELKARKFIEMVREYSLHVDENQSRSPASSYNSTTTASISDNNEEDDTMDVDEDNSNKQSPHQQQKTSTVIERKKRSRQSNSSHENDGFMDSGFVLSDEETTKDTLLEKIMDYGQKLKNEYRYDQRPEVEARLKEIFSLFAYADPSKGRMSYLMDISNRETLATKLNSVMLALQHRPEEPPLERLYRQTIATNRQLAYIGHASSLLLPDITDPKSFS